MAARRCVFSLFLFLTACSGIPQSSSPVVPGRSAIPSLVPPLASLRSVGSEPITITESSDGSIRIQSGGGGGMVDLLSLDPDLLNPEIAAFLFPSCLPAITEVQKR